MDTGSRKSTITALAVAALIAGGKFELATGLAAFYLALNTFLHYKQRDGVDEE